jgi:branched-chain amino acid transport system permease protein
MSARTVLASAVLLAVLVAATWAKLLPSYYVGLLTEALILGLFAMSLDLLIGFLGLDSLGHAAFLGIGAYVSALLSLRGIDNVFVLLAAGIVAAALLGAVLSAVALRAVGPYFLMITLALGYLPWALAIRWRALTGGDDGLPGLFRPDLLPGLSLDSGRNYLTFVVIVFIVCHAAMAALGRSSFGYTLRGIKDSAVRMEALGYNVWWLKFVCAIVAASFAGIAGVLIGFYNGFVSPNDLSIYRSVEAMVAVILGGAGTLIGPAIAAGLILVVRLGVSGLTTHWAMVLGFLYIGVVVLAPRGFYVAWRDILARVRKTA